MFREVSSTPPPWGGWGDTLFYYYFRHFILFALSYNISTLFGSKLHRIIATQNFKWSHTGGKIDPSKWTTIFLQKNIFNFNQWNN